MENGKWREGGKEERPGVCDLVAMAVIIFCCLAFRLPRLDGQGLVLDELWHAEILAGNGSAHLRLPTDVLLSPPDLFTPVAPWWHIWSRVGMNHPPLNFILLRWWMNVFGGTDDSLRMFNVIASTLAAVVLYDAVRLGNGRGTAICAALLMAVAVPQVDYGRQVLDYAQLMLSALIAIDMLIRIELRGTNWRRIIGLGMACLAMLLTHYFAVFGIGALLLYVILSLRGGQRRWVIGCFICVAVIFAIVWGRFMWAQRQMFSLLDPSVSFLINRGPGRVWLSIHQALAAPAMLLAPAGSSMGYASMCMAVLFVFPFVMRRRDCLIWGIWLLGIVLPLLGMDLIRQSNHLGYVRYYMLAGPGVYVLIPAIFARARWGLRYLLTGAAMLTCATQTWDIYHPINSDVRLFASVMGSRMGPEDVCVFMGPGRSYWRAGVQYMMLQRYLPHVPCRIIIATEPPQGDVLGVILRSRYVFAFSAGDSDPKHFLPGLKQIDGRFFLGGGMIYQLVPGGAGRGREN